MRTISKKIQLAFITLSIVIIVLMTGILIWESAQTTVSISDDVLLSKLNGDIKSANLYLEKCFCELEYVDGALCDNDGNAIDDRFEMVDAIQADLGDVATIFAKQDDDFVRVVTNIKKEDGTRAIGTMLGKESQAYENMMKGELFLGEADILGESYLTAYDPIFDDDGNVIGILFIGISRANIEAMMSEATLDFLMVVIIAVIVAVILSVIIAKSFSKLITNPIVKTINQLRLTSENLSGTSIQLTNNSKKCRKIPVRR